jgi:regulator of cell morphogenesis and NO signaling
VSHIAAGEQTRTLADLVAESPARAAVLDRLGLDFCCHGRRPLREACAASGLDVADVTAALDAVADVVPAGWNGGGRASLATYVEDVHHTYLHRELSPLRALAGKVFSVHGGRHPELAEVRDLVDRIVDDLGPHLATEEREVFPAIGQLAPGTAGDERLAARIDRLVEEHTALGALLARLREATRGYAAPADGCASYRSLYERLAALEADTHVHIHLENNVLFPAALVEAV